MDDTISLATLVQFLELPGAKDILVGYASIPPGRLRQTAIDQVLALAEAYQGLPAAPVEVAPPALPSPPEPPTNDPRTLAVKMRLDGKTTLEITAATGLNVHQVYAAVGAARAAGVKFAKIKRMAAGVLNNKRSTNFARTIEEISELGLPRMQAAADRRGLSLEDYVGLRRQAIDMAIRGDSLTVIMQAVGQNRQTLSNWFNMARQAGLPIPYVGIPAPEPNVVPLEPDEDHRTFCTTLEEYNASGKVRSAVDRGARESGLSVAEFLRTRRDVLTLVQQGLSSSVIAARCGLSEKQVTNWRTRARDAGKLPPLRDDQRRVHRLP